MLKETLIKSADVLLGEEFHFHVIEEKRSWFKTKKIKHELSIPALNMFTLVRISREVMHIDKDLFKGNFVSASMQLLAKHGDRILKIVAYAVLNGDDVKGNSFATKLKLINKEPDKVLVEKLGLLTSAQLLEIVNHIVKQLDLKSFTTSIISISGVNVMEVNPKDQGS